MGVFGANASKTKIFQAGEATVTVDTLGTAIFLGVQVQFSRNMQPIPTIGSGVIWSAQPPTGTITADTVLAKDGNFISKLKEDKVKCEAGTMKVNMKGTCDSAGVNLTLKGVYCNSVGFTMSGNQGYVASNVQFMFSELS